MENHDSQVFINNILANTLHEVRTPIQTIIGTLELMSETKLNDEQTEYIRQIQFSAEVLLTLANNVLDFSKINSREFKLENITFNVHAMVEQVTDLICIEAFNKGLDVITDIALDVPEIIIGDPTRIQQILLNLLKNAVKFTKSGHVYCRASVEKNRKNLLFEVIDTGIGLSEENSDKLFTSFFQGDASISRKYGGTGLGLSICKSLATLMKGSIGAENQSPKGSRFWFSIPLQIPHAASAQQENIYAIPQCKNKKILIVDNDELACKSLSNKIQRCGINNISIAYSANEALALIEIAENAKNPFSVVFIDMLMPEINGWHLASKIHTKNLCKETKLYLCVPEGQMGGEAKMKLLNWFNGYLYKPVKQKKLCHILQQATGCSLPELENQFQLDTQAHTPSIQNENHVFTELSVLVAEDHPVNRKLIVAFLQKLGVKVTQACDGNEAIEAIQMAPGTNIVFMDIQMPNKDGIEATDIIRNLGYQGIIIACTANNDFSTVEEYERHGFNDTLIKPFKSSTIKDILLKWQDFCIMPAELVPEEEPENAEEIQEQAEKIERWDLPDFLDTIANDANLGIKLIAEFKTQTEQLIKESEQAVAEHNFLFLRRAGHTLNGSSASLSIFKLAKYGEHLNINAKKQDIQELNRILNVIKIEFHEFCKKSQEWVQKLCIE